MKTFSEVEFLDLLNKNLEFIRCSGVEYVYNCPLCEVLRGSPDTKGHLYFNIVTQIGYCHRHGSKVSIYDVVEDFSVRSNYKEILTLRDKLLLDDKYTELKSKSALKEFRDNIEPF